MYSACTWLYNTTTGTTIGFLHELFARFGVVDCMVNDNGSQFTSVEFKEIFQIKSITTPQDYPRLNGQAERFVDTLKQPLKKASGTPTDKALQQFLQVYRITHNPNTPLVVSAAETRFARKIKSVFDKLLAKQNKPRKTILVPKKRFNPEEKIYFKKYQNNTSCWERGMIKKRIGDMVYIVEGPKYTHKRHQNQLQKLPLNDSNDVPRTEEEPIDTIFVMFDLDPPQSTPEIGRSRRKRKFTDPLKIEPKRKKKLIALLGSKTLGGGVLWEPYLSYHNGLFSPLLVQKISLPEADQYR